MEATRAGKREPQASAAQQLRQIRERRGESQVVFAGAIGISKGYLCNIEAGRRTPSLRVATAIQRVIGIPADAWAAVPVAA